MLGIYFSFAVYHAGSFSDFVSLVKNPNSNIPQKIDTTADLDVAQEQESENNESFQDIPQYSSSVTADILVDSKSSNSPKQFGIIKKYVYLDKSIPDTYEFQVNDLLSETPIHKVSIDNLLVGRDFAAATKPGLIPRIETLEFVQIDDEHLYLIVFEDQILKIDPITFALTDVTEAYLSKFEELSVGIASIKPNEDASFKIKTADNKLYHYYPLSEKLFDDATYDAGIKKDPNIQPINEYYIAGQFKEPRKLMMREIKYNNFAPYDEPSHLFSRNKGKDFTPGRVYFEPYILSVNSEQVILSDRINAQPNSGIKVEALDAKTGQVLWSHEYSDVVSLLNLKGGYLIYQSNSKPTIADHVGFDGALLGKKQLYFISL